MTRPHAAQSDAARSDRAPPIKRPPLLAASLLATLGAFSDRQTADLAALSRRASLLTFAGVGPSTDPRTSRALGWRPLAVAGMAGIAIATFAPVVLAERAGWL